MGGSEVIHAIKTLSPKPVETPEFQSVSEQMKFYAWRYSLGDIHDASLSLAQPIDVVVCIASIGIAVVCNFRVALRRFLWPHGLVLAAFVAFVTWNGGVVLGDKSNHVATVHLAQLLYIWPFFAFFSAPLFIPPILNLATTVYQIIMSLRQRQPSLASPKGAFPSHLAITALVSCGALVITLLVVRFNTIIHPFTLADNRHYVFYVFRYSILRAWWVRYALVPVYVICAWLCWAVLRGSEVSQERWIRSPFATASSKTPPSAHPNKIKEASARGLSETELEVGLKSPSTSTVLVLLLATSLSLMTAPLVEPRYFILPWVFWRLLVPATPTPSLSSLSQPSVAESDTNQSKQSRQIRARSSNYVPILFLETAWFVFINAATMYIFVTRPFYWRAPDNTPLDEGRVQRFMW
ncbi:hypothetical protein ANO14919_017210 [Xylariales sp. No.14919]|nr:hypothetical protein ANO14919_017210 [Xylariales sp. No.14919]